MENSGDRPELYLTTAELEAGLDHIRQSPKDEGTLKYIVVRPEVDQRVVLQECEVSAEQGVHGDNWLRKGRPDVDGQILLMNARAIELLARTPDRWALAGDQLYVDLDLSEDNLQAGQRLKLGSAILEVTDKPHKGCAKFARRFGKEALEFVNSPQGWQLHLRGICTRVVQDGTAKVGDRVVKVANSI
jgi:MOSC domain-containing protein YiiM